ncbi:hypothetical protein NX862_15100 [Rhodobacter sp. KR11]|uniref:hypothetical protein n=1 Tax=Rhodobacter sp. KR11 TaxID=2974588 RepID=UPI00222314B0|nr:hypothetical protein [Rhodobacter sp. KR11]MCW1920086.1 hypothetical protein [Rhodobacter sp. KR11]
MKDLAAFLEGGPATGARFAGHGFAAPELAREVLAGRKVMAMGEIWARVTEGLSPELAASCLGVCGDRAEAAALLMGPGLGAPVTLDEVARVTTEGVFALAARMSPTERAWFFRLISGARRDVVVEEAGGPGECLAVLTMIEGDQGQFAVRRGNGLVPLAKLPLGPHGAEVLAWARGAVLERFGPLRSVRAEQVFRIGWDARVINKRRKIGHDLVGARVLAWEKGASADQIAEG